MSYIKNKFYTNILYTITHNYYYYFYIFLQSRCPCQPKLFKDQYVQNKKVIINYTKKISLFISVINKFN